MNPLMKQLINKKLTTLNTSELQKLGRKYHLTINNEESIAIVRVIKNNPVDIFNESERKDLLRRIAQATDPNLAKNMERLFINFIK